MPVDGAANLLQVLEILMFSAWRSKLYQHGCQQEVVKIVRPPTKDQKDRLVDDVTA
jgi:hypothetical protein